MSLPKTVVQRVLSIAAKEHIDPAGLLAVVQIEGAGKQPVETAGPYPRFLFERHTFYTQLQALDPSKLQTAVRAGLAHKGWKRDTQYQDQGTSTGRVTLLEKAKALNVEAAYRSCSWGVGQIMGFNFNIVGFKSAVEMVEYMQKGGQPEQYEVMIRFLKAKKLIPAINAKDFATVARIYNGEGYKANQYDTKMAVAYKNWSRELKRNGDPNPLMVPEPDLPPLRMDPAPATTIESKEGVAAATTAGTGFLGVVSEVMNQIAALPESLFGFVATLVARPQFWVFVAIIAVGIFLYYQRSRKLKDVGA